MARLGALPDWSGRPAGLLEEIRASGLTGRGGGHFPLAAKLDAACGAGGPTVVVVNATESEPASRKDRLLLTHRPHLVLDGAQALADAAGAARVIVAVHAGGPGAGSLSDALAERPGGRLPVEVVAVPDRYVAGESSALVSFLNGGHARPGARDRPTAVCGVGGRPTVVSNAETVGHVALIARFGAGWFRAAGTPGSPGSVLLTVTGDVLRPGQVVEVLHPVSIGEVVRAVGGWSVAPPAVLLGGYAGTWVRGDEAWVSPVDPHRLARQGTPLGCGLIGVLGQGACGLVEAARLAGWLSAERAGQCGACTLGLPALAEGMARVAEGRGRGRREVHRLVALGESVAGRGLCRLPDGAITMVESALATFSEELRLHRRGRCSAASRRCTFELPVDG